MPLSRFGDERCPRRFPQLAHPRGFRLLDGRRDDILRTLTAERVRWARTDLQYSLQLAGCFPILDDNDRAFDWLENAVRCALVTAYGKKVVAVAPKNAGTSGIALFQAAAAAELTRSTTSGVN